jgi:hypothetical protein
LPKLDVRFPASSESIELESEGLLERRLLLNTAASPSCSVGGILRLFWVICGPKNERRVSQIVRSEGGVNDDRGEQREKKRRESIEGRKGK